jgi:hypothetical protein
VSQRRGVPQRSLASQEVLRGFVACPAAELTGARFGLRLTHYRSHSVLKRTSSCMLVGCFVCI